MSILNFISFRIVISFFLGVFYSFLLFDFIIEIIFGSVLIGMIFFLIFSLSTVIISLFRDKDEESYNINSSDIVLEEYKITINKQQKKFMEYTKFDKDDDASS
jgi:hypothetical protein